MRRILFSLYALAYFSGSTSAQDLRFVTLDFAPFIYGEDQRVAGPGRDLIETACLEASLDCTFDIFPWRRAQELMRSGDADGMMVIGKNVEREGWLEFSTPLFRTEYGVFVVDANQLEFKDTSQIAGYRVGVFAPSNTARKLEAIKDQLITDGLNPVVIDERPDDISGFRKLAAGRLDAVYSNRDRGRQVLADNGLSKRVRYAGQDQGILYYAAIRRSIGDPETASRFFGALEKIYASGQAQNIIESYGLEPAPQIGNN